jgi:hypothetical protein
MKDLRATESLREMRADDDTRRGWPSCHKVFGKRSALLVGDGLLSMTFEELAGGLLVLDEGGDHE